MQPSEIHLNANNPFVNPNTLLNLHPHQGNADPAAPVNNMNGAAPNLPNQENAAPIPSVPPAVEPPGQVQSINKDLIIIFLKGRGRDTIQDRTKGAKLRCLSTPDAIQGALLVILQKERVCIPLYHFRFAYHTGPKTAGIGIYDYQMDNDITLPEIHHFSLSETPQDPANPNSSNPTTTPSAQQTNTNVRNNNKLYYAQRNLKMDEGDCMLRKVLSSEEYGMLKNDRQLWTKWRYKLSLTPDSLEDPEIFLELQADIYNKKNNHNKNNSRHVSHGITGVNPIQNQDTQGTGSMRQMQEMMMLNMLQNMQRSQAQLKQPSYGQYGPAQYPPPYGQYGPAQYPPHVQYPAAPTMPHIPIMPAPHIPTAAPIMPPIDVPPIMSPIAAAPIIPPVMPSVPTHPIIASPASLSFNASPASLSFNPVHGTSYKAPNNNPTK
eukprot:128869_1